MIETSIIQVSGKRGRVLRDGRKVLARGPISTIHEDHDQASGLTLILNGPNGEMFKVNLANGDVRRIAATFPAHAAVERFGEQRVGEFIAFLAAVFPDLT